MAKKNFYAVKGTLTPTIYKSWAECSSVVKGKKGSLFKGFETLIEAESWLSVRELDHIDDDTTMIYVDGSYSPSASEYAGWGFVVVKNGKEVFAESGCSDAPALSRNIDGELLATINAIDWCKNNNEEKVVICHDYEGIARWAQGEWNAKSEIAILYVANVQKKLKGISFKKVSGHSGDKWNDRADELAKAGIGLK